MPAPRVSNAQVDRAGRTFREWWLDDVLRGRFENEGHVPEEVLDAFGVIEEFRAMHAYPMTKVTMGVRQMIQTELGPGAPRPTQRFKRRDRIINKLFRPETITMRLSQMEDIGGCRAVFADLAALRQAEVRIRRRWAHEIVERACNDYIANPKQDGYRCLHIVTRRDGRLIEVQLRTARQHEWAEAVENAEAATGFNAKDGHGPEDLRRYFLLAAERLACEDRGVPIDDEVEAEFVTVREEIRRYYRAR